MISSTSNTQTNYTEFLIGLVAGATAIIVVKIISIALETLINRLQSEAKSSQPIVLSTNTIFQK